MLLGQAGSSGLIVKHVKFLNVAGKIDGQKSNRQRILFQAPQHDCNHKYSLPPKEKRGPNYFL